MKQKCLAYIVKHNTHKDIQGNTEEVHDGAPRLLRDVLGSHFHNWWPEYPDTCLKSAEPQKLNASSKWYATPFYTRRCYKELLGIAK